MRAAIRAFFKSLPLAAGILLTVTSFMLLIDAGEVDVDSDEFVGFVILGLLGIPAIFAGLSIVSRKDAQ
jgi:hypothetical protein